MKKTYLIGSTAVVLAVIAGITGCGTEDDDKNAASGRYEAENGKIKGKFELVSDPVNASGGAYIKALTEEGDQISITVNVADSGYYDLVFKGSGIGGKKENIVFVDNICEGTLITSESEEFEESLLKRVYLSKGQHMVILKKDWGWIALDYLSLRESAPFDQRNYQVERQLADKAADDCAVALMDYLCSIYGVKMLSGQYCLTGPDGEEMKIIRNVTGKQPAILAMDMRDYSLSAQNHGARPQVMQWAADYWNKGGIISLSWHWYVPEQYTIGEWWEAFYVDETTIDLVAILSGADPEGYQLLMDDMDAVAIALKELQQQGIPVLWRPFHEGSGGWFWWAKGGAECYKELWRLMFNKFTTEHGLHNLIWIYSGMAKEWYPGDEYVDIIGEDIYVKERTESPQGDKFLNALAYTENTKLIMLSESSFLPEPEILVQEEIYWLGCILWGEEYLIKTPGSNQLSTEYITNSLLQTYYQHERIVTLEELPDF